MFFFLLTAFHYGITESLEEPREVQKNDSSSSFAASLSSSSGRSWAYISIRQVLLNCKERTKPCLPSTCITHLFFHNDVLMNLSGHVDVAEVATPVKLSILTLIIFFLLFKTHADNSRLIILRQIDNPQREMRNVLLSSVSFVGNVSFY